MEVVTGVICAIAIVAIVVWIDCKYARKKPVVKINDVTVTLPPLEHMKIGQTFNIENNSGCDVTVTRHPDDQFILKARNNVCTIADLTRKADVLIKRRQRKIK